jgi:WD40 repeat protein
MRAVRFLPDDRLLVGGDAGLFLTKVQRPSGSNDPLRFSQPAALWTNRFLGGPNDFALARDHRTLIVRADTNAAVVLDLTGERSPLSLQPHPQITYVALSPDGRWAATASGRDEEVRIWDVSNGALLKRLPGAGPARVAFGPKDGQLIITSRGACSILQKGTWKVLHKIPRPPAPRDFPPRTVLSADGELMAIAWTGDLVRLIHLPSGEPLMDLQALGQTPLCFSPYNGKLYVLGQYGEIHFWDLGHARRHLAKIALDWEVANRTAFSK